MRLASIGMEYPETQPPNTFVSTTILINYASRFWTIHWRAVATEVNETFALRDSADRLLGIRGGHGAIWY
jgi:hypothetical protein